MKLELNRRFYFENTLEFWEFCFMILNFLKKLWMISWWNLGVLERIYKNLVGHISVETFAGFFIDCRQNIKRNVCDKCSWFRKEEFAKIEQMLSRSHNSMLRKTISGQHYKKKSADIEVLTSSNGFLEIISGFNRNSRNFLKQFFIDFILDKVIETVSLP